MRFSVIALLASFVGTGCQTAKVAQPLTPELAGSEIEFWHALPERKAVSNDEAFHALLLFADGTDAAADYDGRVQLLKERHMLPAGFDGAPGDVARRGIVAMALARTLNIKGGLTMQLFGASPRYAVREMQYAGLFPPSSPQQTFSGAEFLGIIGRAEDYQRGQFEDALSDGPAAPAASDGGA